MSRVGFLTKKDTEFMRQYMADRNDKGVVCPVCESVYASDF